MTFLYTILFILFILSEFAISIITSNGPGPIGLFIQVEGWWPLETIEQQLTHICQHHRYSTGQNQVVDHLVIGDIVKIDTAANKLADPPESTTNDVLLWDKVEPLLKFFPGGNGPCTFARIFVGSFQQMGVPSGFWHAYIDGIANQQWRNNLRLRQIAIAKQFAAKVATSSNPNVKWEWYINQEVGMEYAWHCNVMEGYLDYLTKIMIDLNTIVPNRAFMWSPYFEYNPIMWPSDKANIILSKWKYMFNQIPVKISASIPACASAATCPFELALQDHVGGGLVTNHNITKEDAVTWFRRLQDIFPFKSLKMNVELFMHNSRSNDWMNSYHTADCLEVKNRQQHYVSQGITLGPAFELRHFYKCNNPGSDRVCDSGWTQFNQYCYKKIREFKTWTQANTACGSLGAKLVSIHSKAENDFVKGLNYVSEASIWIGLSSPYSFNGTYEGIPVGAAIFQWSDDKPLDYWNWAPWNPNNQLAKDGVKVNQCGAMYTATGNGQWANIECHWYADEFVCKK